MPSAAKHVLVLLAVTFVLFFPSLTASFVYDDHFLIEKNPFLSSPRAVKMAFTTDYYAQSNPLYRLGYYRPLAILSHWIDWQLWHDNPFGHHLTNVAMHLGVVVLLYFCVLRILEDPLLSFFTALVFALHPAHVSTVTFVSARVDMLATLFVLATLLVFTKKKALAPPFYFLGLLSKEMSVTAPALVWWRERERGLRSAFLWMIPFTAVLALVVALRWSVLGRPTRGEFVLDAQSLWNLLEYVRLMVLPPVQLYLEPSAPPAPAVTNVLVFAAVIAAVVLHPDRRRAMWSAVWLITLLPVLGLVRIETTIDQRFVYLPSVGVCLLAASWVITYLKRSRPDGDVPVRDVRIATVAVAALCAPLLLTQQAYWQSDLSLWGAAVDAEPDAARPRYRYAMALIDNRQPALAERELKEALRRKQDDPSITGAIYANIAIARQLQRRSDGVEALYRRAIELRPKYETAHYNLGMHLAQLGRIDEAIVQFEKAVEANPYSAQARLYLADLLDRRGRKREAQQHRRFVQTLYGQ
ncbi:MAG TPA: tetratricopeptide repeat protein [Thermoanaerobaculia bacterium]|nr:tetratricopeptide repeat protein [Thermoanaerobaculia bacterium]